MQGLGWVARRRDVGLAAALCGLGLVELLGGEQYNGRPVWPGPTAVDVLVVLAMTLPFAWRRSRPLAAALVVFAVLTVSSLVLGGSEAATVFVVLIVASFSGAAYSRHVVVVVAAAVVAALAHGVNDPSSKGLADLTWTYGLVAVSVLLGRAVWVRSHRIAALESDASSAEQRHARELAAATAAERAAIARELHDIVSHAVSVIVIQSQAGSRALPSRLDVVADSLAAIESSARSAMTELRQLLRMLGTEDETAAVAPMVSLRQVDELLEQCRASVWSSTRTSTPRRRSSRRWRTWRRTG